MQNKSLALASLLAVTLLTACPPDGPIVEPPPPTSNPFSSSSPGSSPTPFPVTTPTPNTQPIQFTLASNGNIASEVFNLEFGPGSKGFDFGPGSKGFEFGPGSKGFEFGPGSKGFEFGPGSKGFNLLFDIRYPDALTRDTSAFRVQQTTELQELVIEFIRDNQLYATATALPVRPVIGVPARFEAGTYQMSVLLKTGETARQISWKQLTIEENKKTTLKISVFGDQNTRPEDLDIELVSKREDF